MAVPWFRILDAALNLADLALTGRPRRPKPGSAELSEPLERPLIPGGALGHLETRLAGVVVAALKEAFDRDSRRLELERQQVEAERERAERALRLEWQRQTGDRELGRLRLIAGAGVVSWLGTLFFSARLIGGTVGARVALAGGWVLLLAAIATAFAAQSRVGASLARMNVDRQDNDALDAGLAGQLAPWLIVIGLGVVGLAVLLS
jgi:hypothetical protein